MPAHQREDHAEDVDPTGIRDLLAALPDPGPMPDDLVRRIEARLEVERAHQRAQEGRSSGAFSAAGDTSPIARADNVFDLAAERSHRNPARTVTVLGAAAATLLVTTVAVTQMMGISDGASSANPAASYPSLSRSADEAAADDAGGAAADEAFEGGDEGGADDASVGGADLDAQTGSAESQTEDSAGTWSVASDPDLAGSMLRVLPDLGPVTTQDVAATLRAALDDDARFSRGDLTLEQARSCWKVLAGEYAFDSYIAAGAQYVESSREGLPAVALLGLDDDGTGRAWIMPRTCIDAPQVAPLSGPHPLG